MQTIAPESIHL